MHRLERRSFLRKLIPFRGWWSSPSLCLAYRDEVFLFCAAFHLSLTLPFLCFFLSLTSIPASLRNLPAWREEDSMDPGAGCVFHGLAPALFLHGLSFFFYSPPNTQNLVHRDNRFWIAVTIFHPLVFRTTPVLSWNIVPSRGNVGFFWSPFTFSTCPHLAEVFPFQKRERQATFFPPRANLVVHGCCFFLPLDHLFFIDLLRFADQETLPPLSFLASVFSNFRGPLRQV